MLGFPSLLSSGYIAIVTVFMMDGWMAGMVLHGMDGYELTTVALSLSVLLFG